MNGKYKEAATRKKKLFFYFARHENTKNKNGKCFSS
jgi:hypothetical protein